MPIYEYRCENGHTFEVRQSMTDDALTACQVCDAPVRKVLHSPAIHFKGSGFYNTDHGTRQANKAKEAVGAETGSSDASGSDSGSSPSTESTTGSDSGSGSAKSTSGDSGSKVGAGSKSD